MVTRPSHATCRRKLALQLVWCKRASRLALYICFAGFAHARAIFTGPHLTLRGAFQIDFARLRLSVLAATPFSIRLAQSLPHGTLVFFFALVPALLQSAFLLPFVLVQGHALLGWQHHRTHALGRGLRGRKLVR